MQKANFYLQLIYSTNMLREENYKFNQVDLGENENNIKEKQSLSLFHKLMANWVLTDPTYVNNKNNLKNYQIQSHKDLKYVYLFGGRLRTVKQKPFNLICGILIILPGVLYWIFEANWLWNHVHGSLVILFTYFWFLSISFFIKASTSDPGLVSRNIHFPLTLNEQIIPDHAPPDEYFNTISLPYYGDESNFGASIRYCITCHVWRPPRTSHCGVCNSCIVVHDHHCVFLNNCVGSRNYKYFLWFLLSTTIATMLLFIPSFIHLFHYKISNDGVRQISSFHSSVSTYPMSLFLILYGCLAFCYPCMLLFGHLFLTACNLTTREYLNYVRGTHRKKYINVYDTHSIFKNIYINWLGNPKSISAVSFKSNHEKGDIRFQKIQSFKSFNS